MSLASLAAGVLVIVALSDGIVWLRWARSPQGSRSGQLIGAVALLVTCAAVAFILIQSLS